MAMRGQTSRAAARSKRRRLSGGIDVLEQRVLRPRWRLRKETGSGYDHLVATGDVDRHEWALVVRELLDVEGVEKKHGSKTRFAGKAGVTTRTVDTWLAELVDVKESNVRAVASAYDLNALELFVRVGVYSVEQLPRISHEEMNEERRRVLDSDFDDVTKAQILVELDRMEEEDEKFLQQLRERDRQRRLERLAVIMEQKRTA